jgi:hypothetical protein
MSDISAVLSGWTMVKLQNELRASSLPTSGSKAQLVSRFTQALAG